MGWWVGLVGSADSDGWQVGRIKRKKNGKTFEFVLLTALINGVTRTLCSPKAVQTLAF